MELDERFRANERVTKASEFERVFAGGDKKYSKNFTLIHLKNNNRKIGIIISRKIKGTVIRNKLKRRLRDIYRKNKTCFEGELVIIVQPGAEKSTYAEIKTEILQFIKRFSF